MFPKLGVLLATLAKWNQSLLVKQTYHRLLNFTEMISEINSSLASYKGMAEQDVSKMIKAGENKARDDKAGASSMKIVGK